MKKMMTRVHLWAYLMLGSTAYSAGFFNTDFENYATGSSFLSPQDGWRANTNSVVVTTNEAYSPTNSILVQGPAASLSNTVSEVTPAAVWTEFRIKPELMTPNPYSPPTATFVQYFNLDGFPVILTTGGVWRICTNDVWGTPIDPVSATNWVDVAVFQDFAHGHQSLFINDRLLVQELPFSAPAANYNHLIVNTLLNQSYLDDVRVQPTFETGRLTNDYNGNTIADAAEMQAYGYCGRTLRVGTGEEFTTLQAAVDVYRALDTLLVVDSTFNENVTVSSNLIFSGATFTNSGTLTVITGSTVTFDSSSSWNTLVCTGAVTIAGSGTLHLDNLAMGSAGTIASGSGRLIVDAAGVDLSGPFTVNGATWGQDVVAALPFQDAFESYSDGMTLQAAGFVGWGASDAGVVVHTAMGVGASKAAYVPGGSILSNRVSSTATNVWTEFYGQLARGYALNYMPTGSSAFISCLDTNGYLNVWMSNTWNVCSNDALGNPVDPVDTNTFVRVDVFTDYTTHRYALFLDGVLIREQAAFPSASVDSYSSLIVKSDDPRASTYLDQVNISALTPASLTNDLDQDSAADAREIGALGSIFACNQWNTGAIYSIR